MPTPDEVMEMSQQLIDQIADPEKHALMQLEHDIILQKLRKVAHLAIIATGANDPVTAVEELIRQYNQMREGIYKNAPPRQFSGGLPCATPERDSYLAQFGITEQIWGFCCNG